VCCLSEGDSDDVRITTGTSENLGTLQMPRFSRVLAPPVSAGRAYGRIVGRRGQRKNQAKTRVAGELGAVPIAAGRRKNEPKTSGPFTHEG
jgi:hypothetical protein